MSGGALKVLITRELLRILRQPTRIVATLGTAAIFWLLVASGFARSIQVSEAGGGDAVSYSAYLLPGIALMVVMFGTVFGAISLIQDRHAGFLQSVLVGPTPLWVVALSKLLPAAVLSTVQGVVVLGAVLFLDGGESGVFGFLLSTLALLATAVGVLGIGLALAWRIDSVAGFHGVMNLVLLPGWVLSGALFPIAGAMVWLAWVMRINPLYWANLCIGEGIGTRAEAGALAWVITLGFPVVSVAILLASVNRAGGVRGPGEG